MLTEELLSSLISEHEKFNENHPKNAPAYNKSNSHEFWTKKNLIN